MRNTERTAGAQQENGADKTGKHQLAYWITGYPFASFSPRSRPLWRIGFIFLSSQDDGTQLDPSQQLTQGVRAGSQLSAADAPEHFVLQMPKRRKKSPGSYTTLRGRGRYPGNLGEPLAWGYGSAGRHPVDPSPPLPSSSHISYTHPLSWGGCAQPLTTQS